MEQAHVMTVAERQYKFYHKNPDSVLSGKILKNLKNKGMVPTTASLRKYSSVLTFDTLLNCYKEFAQNCCDPEKKIVVKNKFLSRLGDLLP